MGKKGKIIAVSSPSGGGKTTIVKRILNEFPEFVFSVSATTRPKRRNEKHGFEYYFISEDEFKKHIGNNDFVEWERFYDYYYGTFKSFITDNVEKGKSIVLEVDVKGALSLKKIYPESHLIFIDPPSLDELVIRLRNRNTESTEDFQKRIDRAKMELELKEKFDYVVENKVLEKAISEVLSLISKIIKE
ncbi:MAG TPA: guanylate kinase [Ignavibacteriaceae bacterium]|nr:guanylate kinase [Ignavibacteriaceae bacterium]